MAKNRDLLKEAIADAKAVREMAIANAKSALEETFSPRIKEMFAAKIQEMEDEDLEEGESIEEAGFEAMDDEDKSFDGMKGNIPEAEIEEEEELNLDELLAELEEEDETTSEEPVMEAEEDEAEEDEAEESEEDEAEEDEGEPLDLEDMTDEDLIKMIEDVIQDMISAGELEAGEGAEEAEEPAEEEIEDEVEMSIDEDINIDELLREIEEEDLDEGKEEKEDMYEEKVTSLTSELEEAYSTIDTLKKDLNEVNLLNAKLLYTNKIFKSKSLNESQKVKVLSSFDKAQNVNEVKLIFETLNEGLKVKPVIKEHLGSASKSILPTKQTKQPIVEENQAFARMQQLAFYQSQQ